MSKIIGVTVGTTINPEKIKPNTAEIKGIIEDYFAENPVVGTPGKNGTDGSKWHIGTDVSNDSTAILKVTGAKVGDFYLNSSTNVYYLAGTTGVWVRQGKLGMTDAETKAYIDDLILKGEW